MRFFQLGRISAQHHEQHFILVIRHSRQSLFYMICFCQRGVCFFCFIEKFIAEIFIQKHLRDDFIFSRRTAQTEVGADGFQVVNHPFGADSNRFNLHYAVHVLSAKYSPEIQASINLTCSTLGCTPLLRHD